MINPERNKRKQNHRNEESGEQKYGRYIFPWASHRKVVVTLLTEA